LTLQKLERSTQTTGRSATLRRKTIRRVN
jgi:hypothetical protein